MCHAFCGNDHIIQHNILVAVKPDLIALFWLIFIPLLSMLFCTVFGITVNIRFHRFDWQKEEQVVKQSASAALGGFAGFFMSLIFIAALLAIPAPYHDLAKLAISVLLIALTLTLYRNNNRTRLENL